MHAAHHTQQPAPGFAGGVGGRSLGSRHIAEAFLPLRAPLSSMVRPARGQWRPSPARPRLRRVVARVARVLLSRVGRGLNGETEFSTATPQHRDTGSGVAPGSPVSGRSWAPTPGPRSVPTTRVTPFLEHETTWISWARGRPTTSLDGIPRADKGGGVPVWLRCRSPSENGAGPACRSAWAAERAAATLPAHAAPHGASPVADATAPAR